jgi:hypothetical protein
MNAYLYLAIHDVAAIAGGVYLVTHDYPWWGALCFFLAATTTVKGLRK